MKLISAITAALVIFLAVAAFRLSFDALRTLAVANSISVNLAWLFPLVIDGFIIAAILSILRNSLTAEGKGYQWVLVVVFTFLSIAGNVMHINGATWQQRAVAAVPPVALFLAAHLFVRQIESDIARVGAFLSQGQMDAQLAGQQAELTRILTLTQRAEERHARKLAAMRDERRAEPAPAPTIASTNGSKSAQIAERRRVVGDMLAAGVADSDIAQAVGVSLRTIERDAEVINVGTT